MSYSLASARVAICFSPQRANKNTSFEAQSDTHVIAVYASRDQPGLNSTGLGPGWIALACGWRTHPDHFVFSSTRLMHLTSLGWQAIPMLAQL
jgi:hypothetical protein